MARRPRLVRIPVTSALRNEFAQVLHTSLWCLEHAPTEVAPIRVGVNTIDQLLGRLSVSDLHEAMLRLDAMRRAAA